MARYFSRRPTADFWLDDGPLLPSVVVPEHEAKSTGLLDRFGNEIMRAPNPMGFRWD